MGVQVGQRFSVQPRVGTGQTLGPFDGSGADWQHTGIAFPAHYFQQRGACQDDGAETGILDILGPTKLQNEMEICCLDELCVLFS